MKIKFSLGRDGGTLAVQREKDDPRAKASGFTREVHGWGAEIHLLYMIRVALNAMGFNLASVKVSDDGHLMGDDHMRYLRTPLRSLRKSDVDYPYLYIIDDHYAVRSSSEEYNQGDEVCFKITGNPFATDFPQPDWHEKVKAICDKHKIPCEVAQKRHDRVSVDTHQES